MNWDDLKIALAIGRAGSLSRAAEALDMDQSTVGRRLSALEAALGTILFIRSKSGLTPTEAGEAAIQRAIEIELRLARLNEDLERGTDGPSGLVRLVGNPWTLELLARHSLAEFLTAHPRLDLRMNSAHPRRAARIEATLSLWFELPPRESEFAIKLGDVPYAIYAARGVDPGTLPWFSFFDEDIPRLAPARSLERLRRRDERIRLTSNDTPTLLAAAGAGVGKGFLPMCLAEGRSRLARTGTGAPEILRALHLHLHPDTVQTRRVQAVILWLRQSFATAFATPTIATETDFV